MIPAAILKILMGMGADAAIKRIIKEGRKEFNSDAFREDKNKELLRVATILTDRGVGGLEGLVGKLADRVAKTEIAQPADLIVEGYTPHQMLIGSYLGEGHEPVSQYRAGRARHLVETADKEIFPEVLPGIPADDNSGVRLQALRDLAGYAVEDVPSVIDYLEQHVEDQMSGVMGTYAREKELLMQGDLDAHGVEQRMEEINNGMQEFTQLMERTGQVARVLRHYEPQLSDVLTDYHTQPPQVEESHD